jgi:hypothetical protein
MWIYAGHCGVLLLIVSALCTKQRFTNGQRTTKSEDRLSNESAMPVADQLTLILASIKQLQNGFTVLSETLEDMEKNKLESKNNIQRLTGEVTQMKGEFKQGIVELTNETRQITSDLADVKIQLQQQRAATHNSTVEISGLVTLVKDQLTHEVNNSLVTVQRRLQQLSEDNATKEGIEQVLQYHLQLVVADINQQLRQLNETSGKFTPHNIVVTLYSYFTAEVMCRDFTLDSTYCSLSSLLLSLLTGRGCTRTYL